MPRQSRPPILPLKMQVTSQPLCPLHSEVTVPLKNAKGGTEAPATRGSLEFSVQLVSCLDGESRVSI